MLLKRYSNKTLPEENPEEEVEKDDKKSCQEELLFPEAVEQVLESHHC